MQRNAMWKCVFVEKEKEKDVDTVGWLMGGWCVIFVGGIVVF